MGTARLNKKRSSKDLIDFIKGNIVSKRHEFLWSETVSLSRTVYKIKGKYLGKKCFIEMIDLNPEIKNIGGVIELYELLKEDMVRHKKMCSNLVKIKKSIKQNKNLDKAASNCNSEEEKEFIGSVSKLISKHK